MINMKMLMVAAVTSGGITHCWCNTSILKSVVTHSNIVKWSIWWALPIGPQRRIFSSDTKGPMPAEMFLQWVLTKLGGQNHLDSTSEQVLCGFYGRVHCRRSTCTCKCIKEKRTPILHSWHYSFMIYITIILQTKSYQVFSSLRKSAVWETSCFFQT